nr:MAG TPA: hypothetical protein [Caudoviricetes sp.]
MASAFWLLLAGAGIADGKTSILQTKNYIVKKNGTYIFTPDEGYDGFKSVGLDAEIPTLDTSDGTLEPQKMLAGTIGYSQDERMVGTIPTYDGATINFAAKGNVITIEGKQYRVLNATGAVAEVVAMYDASTSQAFNATSKTGVFSGGKTGQQYQGSDLDTYLNTTFFATLSATMQAAIVPKTIKQDIWGYSSSVPGDNTYYHQTYGSSNRYYYDNSSGVSYGTAEVGSRNIYALSVREIIDYLGVPENGDFANTDIWQMFWNDNSSQSGAILLRSAYVLDSSFVFDIDGLAGNFNINVCRERYRVRPAFQIDLSKIAWSK